MEHGWNIFVDTGGTFTDCLARASDGSTHVLKVLSSGVIRGRVVSQRDDGWLEIEQPFKVPSNFFVGYKFSALSGGDDRKVLASDAGSIRLSSIPRRSEVYSSGDPVELSSGEEAPILAARILTGTSPGAKLQGVRLRLATTRGTNALLERKGAPTVLFVTRGHGDLLLIGDQTRPDLFALNVRKPGVLYDRVVEVPERLDAQGKILEPLTIQSIEKDIASLVSSGYRCAAIALLHSYRNEEHELSLKRLLLERGFTHVSASAEVAPLIKILPRAQTAVVDAYLSPIIDSYVDRVGDFLDEGALHLMTSAGGLVRADSFSPKDSLLSGPASGVVGAAAAGVAAGYDRLLTFDMGGTSTDVCRFDSALEYDFEHRVGIASILAPAIAVTTVAAGGGSVCSYRQGSLKVGPQSGGAEPGPACYGRGGPLTITDINLLLGRLDETRFQIPIDKRAARAALEQVTGEIQVQNAEALLEGFLEIANETMAGAIRRISIQRGYDPRDYALVSFGGAGGQHACRVAEALDVSRIVIPKNASLLSAVGLEVARIERFGHRQLLVVLRQNRSDGISINLSQRLAKTVKELGAEAVNKVCEEGVSRSHASVQRTILRLRLLGQESALEVDWDGKQDLGCAFDDHYVRTYGYAAPDRPVEVESVRAIAASTAEAPPAQPPEEGKSEAEPHSEPHSEDLASSRSASSVGTEGRYQRCWIGGSWQETLVLERELLDVGEVYPGPVLISEDHSFLVVEPGWSLALHDSAALLLSRRDLES